MKITKKLLMLGLCGGIATGAFYSLGNDNAVQATEEKVETKMLTTDKNLYKSVSENIKLPKAVVFKEDTSTTTYSSFAPTKGENKANDYTKTSLSTSNEGTKYYTHEYANNDHSQKITYNVIGTNTTVDTSGYETKTVYLADGTEATYASGDSAQLLAFNNKKDNLYYALIGEKTNGSFSPEELLEIANSIEK